MDFTAWASAHKRGCHDRDNAIVFVLTDFSPDVAATNHCGSRLETTVSDPVSLNGLASGPLLIGSRGCLSCAERRSRIGCASRHHSFYGYFNAGCASQAAVQNLAQIESWRGLLSGCLELFAMGLRGGCGWC